VGELMIYTVAFALIFIVSGSVYFSTGRSVFHWAARLFIVIDAALICALRVASRAAVEWWRGMPGAIAEVKSEVAG